MELYGKIHSSTRVPVHFSIDFEKKNGRFNVVQQNSKSLKIKIFSVNDVELIRCPSQYMTGIEFQEYVDSLKKIPLNIFHARAIFHDNISMSLLSNLLKTFEWEKGFKLETLNFFGTIVAYQKSSHIVCYKFGPNGDEPKFMAYEVENVWSRTSDLAVVFKSRFKR